MGGSVIAVLIVGALLAVSGLSVLFGKFLDQTDKRAVRTTEKRKKQTLLFANPLSDG